MPRLINKDVRQVLALMGSESVDLVCTDPPYKVISGGSNGEPSGVIAKNDGKIFAHNDIAAEEYLSELFRVLKPQAHLYLFTNFLNLEMFLTALREAGFQIHNLLVWHKNNAVVSQYYMKNAEYVIFARKGRAFGINNAGSKTVECCDNPRDKTHPTEKPVDLLRRYIENSTQPGDLVFDPFMGSGSTGCAALESGRDFLGVELETQYYLRACVRMRIMPS